LFISNKNKAATVSMSFHILAVVFKRWLHFASEHFSESSQQSGSRNSTEAVSKVVVKIQVKFFLNCKVLLTICCCRLLHNNLLLFLRCEITAFEICGSVDFCCVLEEWKKTRETPNVTF